MNPKQDEPRLLTAEERCDYEAELERVLARMTFLLPASKCPQVEAGDGGTSAADYTAIAAEMLTLGKRRDFLRESLRLGINANYAAPIDPPIFIQGGQRTFIKGGQQ
jgi:hypothetical protein